MDVCPDVTMVDRCVWYCMFRGWHHCRMAARSGMMNGDSYFVAQRALISRMDLSPIKQKYSYGGGDLLPGQGGGVPSRQPWENMFRPASDLSMRDGNRAAQSNSYAPTSPPPPITEKSITTKKPVPELETNAYTYQSSALTPSPSASPTGTKAFSYPRIESEREQKSVTPAVTTADWKVTRKVQVFVQVRQIVDLDMALNRFEIIFNAEFSWPDCENQAADAISKKKKMPWTPKILFPNAISIEDISATKMVTVKMSPIAGGWPVVHERKKFRGTFQIPKHSTFHYPFDILDCTMIIQTGHSSDSVEFTRPDKHQVLGIDSEFFYHPEFELVTDRLTGIPAVTLEFHNAVSKGEHPRLYIDMKLKRKHYFQIMAYVASSFTINQMAWIVFLFDSKTDLFVRLVFLGILMFVLIAFHINFSQYFPKAKHFILLSDAYRFVSLIHMVLLMIVSACVRTVEKDQVRASTEIICASILGGLQLIFHVVFGCEVLYARRQERNKITHSSFYQNLVKYGPRVIENIDDSEETPATIKVRRIQDGGITLMT